MPAGIDEIYRSLKFDRDDVDFSQWPKLSCSEAKQLALDSNLKLDTSREILFQGNGQLRASGDILLMTGETTPEKLRILANGNVGIGTSSPAYTLDVNGIVNTTAIYKNGAPWTLTTSEIADNAITATKIQDGSVGQAELAIGAVTELKIANNAVTTAKLADGAVTLEKLAVSVLDRVVKKAGDTMTGALTVNNTLTVSGNVGIGTTTTRANLDVSGTVKAIAFQGDGSGLTGLVGTTQWSNGANGSIYYNGGNVGIGATIPSNTLDVSSSSSEAGIHITNTGIGSPVLRFRKGSTPLSKWGLFVGLTTGSDDKFYLWDYVANTARMILDTSGNVGIGTTTPDASLYVYTTTKNSGNNTACFYAPNIGNNMSHIHWGTTGDWYIRSAASSGRVILQDIGGTVSIGGTTFVGGWTYFPIFRPGSPPTGFWLARDPKANLFVNGDIQFSGNLIGGGKGGYVMDQFVNKLGEALEEGDLVVISGNQASLYYGPNNNIPIPEVDTTQEAYNTRVCGIVCEVYAELTPEASTESGSEPIASRTLTPEEIAQQGRTIVQPDQIGWMVTLGTYAHCKVDADIAPVQIGDLLTTSPTKGHAQKVLDRPQAMGAIIGKALGSLEKGKGKIPVLVMLQ